MKMCVCDSVQMCFSWNPSNSHLTATIIWYQIAWGSVDKLCFCIHLSTQERLSHVVYLCIWFLLISAHLLPVFATHFLCLYQCDTDTPKTQQWIKFTFVVEVNQCVKTSISLVFLLILSIFHVLTSPSCSSALLRYSVWAWTSSFSSSTPSGFAADGARVTIPHTPIRTLSSQVQTAAALPGASSSPRLCAGEGLSTQQLHFPYVLNMPCGWFVKRLKTFV